MTTALRNRTIILLLLDTGVRASELCGLTIKDADLSNKRILVLGKGTLCEERALPISPRTAKALWRYLTTERKDEPVNAPLFLGSEGEPLNRDALLKLLTIRCTFPSGWGPRPACGTVTRTGFATRLP